ncbi:MAG TPA: hypothetical protein VL614_25525 [Acetobacteraceae bacterium]|jgi:hypothetical protein|nr:hypothetical protein [Acetobacteraceae bacterium]
MAAPARISGSAGQIAVFLCALLSVVYLATNGPLSAAPVDQVFAASYGASGSSQATTGSVQAGSRVVQLTDALDFVEGQGIAIWGAGPAFSAGPITGATAQQQGTTGTTTYSYQIAPIDDAGGIGDPVTVSVTNGNAVLTTANNIMISVTYGSGDAGFVVWKSSNGGPYTYDGASSETTWMDTGWTPNWRPGFIPMSPPTAAQADWLVTRIVHGTHARLLLVADAASTSVSGAPVLHDDTAALNAAVSANAANGAEINLPCGTYNLTSTVKVAVAEIGFNGSGMCSIVNGYGVDDDFQWVGTSPSVYLFGGFLQNIYQPGYNKLGGNALTVKYFQNFTYNNVFVDHAWRGAEFFDVNDVRASHDRFVSVWGYRGWTFRMASGPAAGEYACCFDLRDVYANNLSTASSGGGRIGSYGFWIDGNVATVISSNSAVSNVEGTALEISNSVHNPTAPQFLQFTDWGAEFSNGRGISIDAGQEMYFVDPVLHSSRNGNDNVFVDASAKVISFQGGRNGAAGCNGYTINGSDITIANQAIYNASTPSAGGTSGVCQGIVLGPSASNAVILGNRIGQEYGVNWQQRYPVQVAAGATNFSITGNVFKGNQFDYVDMAAGYSSTQVEAGNSGNPPPTLASGFGTGSAIIANSGFRSFQVKVGTDGTASSGVVGLPLAVGGWVCSGSNLTTHSATVSQTAQTASTTSTATLGNFNTAGASAPWSAGDVLNIACQPY